MTDLVIAIVGGFFTLATAWIGVEQWRTRRKTDRIEHSINNRDLPLSDRLDLLHKDVRSVKDEQHEQGQRLARVETRSIETVIDLREHVLIAKKSDDDQAQDSELLHKLAQIYLPKETP